MRRAKAQQNRRWWRRVGVQTTFNVWLLSSFRFHALVRDSVVVLMAAARPIFFEARKFNFSLVLLRNWCFLGKSRVRTSNLQKLGCVRADSAELWSKQVFNRFLLINESLIAWYFWKVAVFHWSKSVRLRVILCDVSPTPYFRQPSY